MLKVTEAVETLPECFGLRFDRDALECVGGLDPVAAERREPCAAMNRCMTRSQAGRQVATAIIPATNLVNRPPPTAFVQPATRTQPSYGYTSSVQPQYHAAPAAGMQQMVPVNYGMPQYLTVREPSDGRGLATRLVVEIVRSLGKAAGHTLANFFDTETLGRKG